MNPNRQSVVVFPAPPMPSANAAKARANRRRERRQDRTRFAPRSGTALRALSVVAEATTCQPRPRTFHSQKTQRAGPPHLNVARTAHHASPKTVQRAAPRYLNAARSLRAAQVHQKKDRCATAHYRTAARIASAPDAVRARLTPKMLAAPRHRRVARIASAVDAVRACLGAAMKNHRRTRHFCAAPVAHRASPKTVQRAASRYLNVARIASAPDAVRARFCPRARRASAPISNPLPAIRKQRKPLKTKPK